MNSFGFQISKKDDPEKNSLLMWIHKECDAANKADNNESDVYRVSSPYYRETTEAEWEEEKEILRFDSLTAKEKFLNHSSIGSWFTELIQVTSSFENDERIVWISIEGLPIKAWTPKPLFRKIASLRGSMWSGKIMI
ncbi:hypothetical protein Tco_0690486 [Tanacetum coccineum]